MGRKEALDVEALHLTRDQVLDIINAIIGYWQRAPGRNWTYTQALRGLKLAVIVMDEGVLNAIWRQVIAAFNELYTLNELKHMAGERPNAQFFVDRLLEKIRSGELFEPRH